MGFALHEFVSCRGHPQLQAQLTALDPFDAESYTCLIAGPPKSGKTSLLMHFALSEAASGRHSAFVCQREKIEKDLPVLAEGMDPHHDLLKAVHMKYVSNVKDLMSFAIDGRFLMDSIDSIVVDDLALLLPPEREKRFENRNDMFRMLASLYELCKTLREGPLDLLLVEQMCSQDSSIGLFTANGSMRVFLYQEICQFFRSVHPKEIKR